MEDTGYFQRTEGIGKSRLIRLSAGESFGPIAVPGLPNGHTAAVWFFLGGAGTVSWQYTGYPDDMVSEGDATVQWLSAPDVTANGEETLVTHVTAIKGSTTVDCDVVISL